ncbi:hypothetical protein [Raoultella ornithinolytica]|uniref:hypothetical protein n=1 Tax=Raoultella ornithinolytica TaxID=54291 RepID=UPI00301D7328
MNINFFPNELSHSLQLNTLSAIDIESRGLYFSNITISEKLFLILLGYYQKNNFIWRVKETKSIDYCYKIDHYALKFSLTKIVRYKYKKTHHINIFMTPCSFRPHPTEDELNKINALMMIDCEYLNIYQLLSTILRNYNEEIVNCSIYLNKEVYHKESKNEFLNTPLIHYTSEYHRKEREKEIKEMERNDKLLANKN